MVEKLNHNSRTTEVDAALARMLGAYKKTSLNSDTYLLDLFTGLEGQAGQMSEAIMRMKAESVLEAKDEVRDSGLRAVFFLVQGFVYHPDSNLKEAAQKVSKVLGHYGLSITDDNYATESSLIGSLLDDLYKPATRSAMAVLSGCTELVAALQVAQNDFEAARIAYEEEKAKEGTLPNATVLKRKIIEVVNNQLVVYMRAMSQVNEAVYGDFARTLAEIIADNNEVVKKRAKKTEPVE